MKASNFFFSTLKETPKDAETISQQLLERAGFVFKLSKGIYAYTPLFSRVLKKMKAIVREELDAIGSLELTLPILHPAGIWEQTGRWHDFTSENLLFTLKDREKRDFCIAPTHEEVIVSYVKSALSSFKQLPFNLYQIGTKFRDEIRPRFGLIRCKEFLMEDGYSFSRNEEEMRKQYYEVRQAYTNILTRFGLDFVIVAADGGKIGKGDSEEFQVKATIGDDTVLMCEKHASNVETTKSIPAAFNYDSELKTMEMVVTKNVSTIDALCEFLVVKPQNILKTIIFKLIGREGEENRFVAIGIRGDRQVNNIKVALYFGALEAVTVSEDEVETLTGCKVGFAGPIDLRIPFYADLSSENMKNFICATNKLDQHNINVNWNRDVQIPEYSDFMLAEAGDSCPEGGGLYEAFKGIEVAHIFNLGVRYSEQMEALFTDENGHRKPFHMGTYGIGITRAASACVEQSNDSKGIIWPVQIAPFVVVIATASLDEKLMIKAEEIYSDLLKHKIDVLFDDRNERLGFKLKDSDLIGIPYKIILGKTFLNNGTVELETRTGDKFELISSDVLMKLQEFGC